MRIAVTGATGYVGQHVVAELDARGVAATIVSKSGRAVRGHPGIALDHHHPPADVFRALGEPDTLIHLAWSGLPNYKSSSHLEAELPAQYTFLEAMIRSGTRNVVVAGTCLEYGMASGELKETAETHPTTPYGIAKDTLRRRLEELQRRRPFNLTWARLFYSYGEGQPAHSLLPQLRAAVERGDASFRMSGGKQVRDYLPIETVAACLAALALRDQHHGVINVCSGIPVTVHEMVQRWLSMYGWSIALELGHYPYPDWEPMEFWGDASRLRAALGADTGAISSPTSTLNP